VSDFNVSNGAISNTTFQAITAKADFRDNRLTIDTTVTEQPGAQLHAAGTIPIAVTGDKAATGDAQMDVRVESTPIDLALFQPLTAHLTQLKGTGQFNVHATGTLKAPRLDGDVSVANASFLVTPTNMSYAAGNARVRFDGERIAIDRFTIEDDDRHTLTIEGGAQVANARDVQAVDLHVSGRDIHLLRNEFGEVGLDTDIRVAGALRSLNITGTARVERGRLEIDKLLEKFNKSAYESEEPFDAPIAPPGPNEAQQPQNAGGANGGQPAGEQRPEQAASSQPAAPAATGSFFDNATMRVTLRMPDDLVLRARDLRLTEGAAGLGSTNITLGGSLEVQKDAGDGPRVVGGIQVVRGFYEFQGRRFEIVRGSEVQFPRHVPIDPSLSVDAERDISGVTAMVGVRGTARQPSIRLSSQPPLDESDVLSLIVFGQPVNSLGESQRVSLAQRAGNLALGAVSGPLAESVGRALNLDLFEIRAEGEGGGPEVAVGQQLGNRIYVGLRQEFGQEDVSTVSFEYRISRVLRLVTAVAQGVQQTHTTRRSDPTGADLIYVIRY